MHTYDFVLKLELNLCKILYIYKSPKDLNKSEFYSIIQCPSLLYLILNSLQYFDRLTIKNIKILINIIKELDILYSTLRGIYSIIIYILLKAKYG